MQIALHDHLVHLGDAVAHVGHRLGDPYDLYGDVARLDIVTDVVTESVRHRVALARREEHRLRSGKRVFQHTRRIGGDSSLHRLLLLDGEGACAALVHEVIAQDVDGILVLLLRLVERALLDALVHLLEIEGDVAHLVLHSVADIGSQCIRQRVEFRQTAHFQRLVAAAGAEQHGTRERRNR